MFLTEGQRLFCESHVRPAEISRLTGIAKPRISDLRNGRFRPNPADRIKIEKVTGIPARMWDAPATTQAKVPEPPKYVRPTKAKPVAPVKPAPTPIVKAQPAQVTPAPTPPAEPAPDHRTGPEGIEQIIRDMRLILPELPAKDRQSALKDIAGQLKALEDMRVKRESAREEYLRSGDFLAEAQALVAAFPTNAEDFRRACARVGVDLPAPPAPHVASSRPAPTCAADVEAMAEVLRFAGELRAHGEPYYALAQVLTLELDVHTEAISGILAGAPELADRFLPLLEPVDRAVIGRALDVRRALEACRGHEPTRALLEAIGRSDLTCTL